MFVHNLDPIIFSLGFVTLRWYSLSYIVGILLGWWLGKKILQLKSRTNQKYIDVKSFDDLITYIVISIIVGGRLGYVFFYNFNFYLSNPIDIIKIWEGGMSFHGGLIGVIVATYFFSISKKMEPFIFLDVIACVAPVGLFFGRVANFINGELFGKPSDLPWAVIFSNVDEISRHPSQLYEAFLEGILLFLILMFLTYKKNIKTGICSSLFLIFYGIFRIFAEQFREPDLQVGYLFGSISLGSFLSFLMVLAGFTMFYKIKNEKKN